MEIIKRAENHKKYDMWVYELMTKLTYEYTEGNSSSIPEETANMLFSSMLYNLGINKQNYEAKMETYIRYNPYDLHRSRVAKTEEKADFCKSLLKDIALVTSDIFCPPLADTLKELKNYLKTYDPHFFAQRVPEGICYSTALSVKPSFEGIDFLVEYLGQLSAELEYIKRFGVDKVNELLSTSEYGAESLNLFEASVTNAMALLILDAPIINLILREEQGKNFSEALTDPSTQLKKAAKILCEKLDIKNYILYSYLANYTKTLISRFEYCLKSGKEPHSLLIIA